MSIEKAIRKLIENYLTAKDDARIYNPVAWALYQTWKDADEDTGVMIDESDS